MGLTGDLSESERKKYHITINIVIAWSILRAGEFLHGKLGKQGSSVVSRLMGLIIGAVAIKLIREALEEILPGLTA